MDSSRDFRKLVVWQKSHQLVLAVYLATAGFPKSQLYGLTSQMQRAAVSIPANIAEGCGRRGRPELTRFMTISQGSASELSYYFVVAHDLGFLEPSASRELSGAVDEVARMLPAYIARLRSNS